MSEKAVRGIRISVRGRVQGVWFRKNTQARARQLGLSGWVKNETDGSVTAEVFGPIEQVDALLRWCHVGPELARVDSVDAVEIPFREEEGFRIEG